MSTDHPRPPVYKITIEPIYSWTDCVWDWKVYRWDNEETPVWTGTTTSKVGARIASKRAVRKLRKGKLPPSPEPEITTIWMYP